MELDILTKQEAEKLIKEHFDSGLLRRSSAAGYLDMPLSTFDAFVAANPHLKKRNGKRIRYCPKELKAAFDKNPKTA